MEVMVPNAAWKQAQATARDGACCKCKCNRQLLLGIGG